MAESTSFDELTMKDFLAYLEGRYSQQASVNLDFLNGNHFGGDEGTYWVGPRRTAQDVLYRESMAEIQRTFVSHNAVAEVTDRHVNGVLSRELHWAFVPDRQLKETTTVNPDTGQEVKHREKPTPAEQVLIEEAQAAVVGWWDKRDVTQTIQHALAASLSIVRAPLRFYVPPALLGEGGTLHADDLMLAMDFVWLQFLGFDEDTLDFVIPTATVWTDKKTRKDIGVFQYKEDDKNLLEVTYLDDLGNTVIRTMNDDGDTQPPIIIPLSKRLTMFEMARKALISQQIISQQKALNMTLTMKQRNAVQGGFLERVLMNVKVPGETDPETGEFTPDPLYVGAGTTNLFQSETFTDSEGKTFVLPGSVTYRDPVPANTFIETENSQYTGILQETHQLHYTLASEGSVSGESRKQARDSFQKDLLYSAGKVESMVRWILETVLALGANFSGQPDRYVGLRAYVQAKVDSGPVSADDMRVAAEMRERGLWDWETAASATGIDDVDAIKVRLADESGVGLFAPKFEQMGQKPPATTSELEGILAANDTL